MIWKTDEAFFRLTLLGYQNPDPQGDPLDDNWLRVRVDAAGPQGAWSVVDPCLLTGEVKQLIDWLADFDAGREAQRGTERGARRPAISFLEPMLLFRRVEVDGQPEIAVHFGGLVYPNWGPQEIPVAREALSLVFPVSKLDLAATVRDLKDQMKKFPVRK
jgi:hypothetical protein